VCVNYAQDEARANRVVDGIRAEGGMAIAVRADVGSDDDVVAMFRRVDAELGALAALVNNAGISGPHSRVDAIRLGDIARMFATNVFGTLLCSREAIRRMSFAHGGKGGSIVNLSSASSRLGGAGRNVHYSASKGAINSMTVGMARGRGGGIRVNAVSPGVIDTESQPPDAPLKSAHAANAARGASRRVANVLWLASEGASYVTGAIPTFQAR
jgi:NAD(P)-dependent dehydrogenase (short-subunit alcohol dehydrogenase family)